MSRGFSTPNRQEYGFRVARGQSSGWTGYPIGLWGADRLDEPHRSSTRARLAVFEGRHDLGELVPALNKYPRMSQSIGTPAVIHRLTEDLYISAVRVASDQVSIRAYVEPMVSWVWLGGILMVLGGLLACLPPLRRRREQEREA